MYSIIEMLSGYSFTAIMICVLLLPVFILGQWGVYVFLNKASEGMINLTPTLSSIIKFIEKKSYGILFGDTLDLVCGVYCYVWFNDTGPWVHATSTKILEFLYLAGVWLTPLFLTALLFVGVYYAIKYVCRLTVKTNKILEAVKEHEANHHSNK